MAKAGALSFLFIAGLAGTAQGPRDDAYELRGERLTARFHVENGGLRGVEVVDARNGARLEPGEAFSIRSCAMGA